MNGSLLDIDDNYLRNVEDVQNEPFVRKVAMVAFVVYVIVIILGIPANICVLCRLRKLAREDKEKYTNGTGMGLFAMAMADLLVLIAYSLLNVLSGFSLSENILMASILCKVLTFTTHAMTSISIWCWLLMSTLRYLAVCHPLFHLRLWRAPHRAIILIIFMSSITNIWLLFAVDQGPSDCVQHPLNGVSNLNRLMHLIESIWSFCLPLAIIIYMDARVLLCRPLDFKTTSGSRLARNNRMRCEAKAALWKWLAIAFIDSLLNTPENLYRLAVLCGMPVAAPNIYNISARIVAQLLYFSQFAFNAVYLAVFIYDRNIRPCTTSASTHSYVSNDMKPSASRQDSASSEHLQREWRHQSQREMRKMAIVQFRQRSRTHSQLSTARSGGEQAPTLQSEI